MPEVHHRVASPGTPALGACFQPLRVCLTHSMQETKIAFGKGITQMEPGSLDNMQVVIDDADEARQYLIDKGVEAGEVQDFPWGRFVFFSDPDGNGWALQQSVNPG